MGFPLGLLASLGLPLGVTCIPLASPWGSWIPPQSGWKTDEGVCSCSFKTKKTLSPVRRTLSRERATVRRAESASVTDSAEYNLFFKWRSGDMSTIPPYYLHVKNLQDLIAIIINNLDCNSAVLWRFKGDAFFPIQTFPGTLIHFRA